MYDNHRLIGVWKLHGVVQHTVNLGTILKSPSAMLNIDRGLPTGLTMSTPTLTRKKP